MGQQVADPTPVLFWVFTSLGLTRMAQPEQKPCALLLPSARVAVRPFLRQECNAVERRNDDSADTLWGYFGYTHQKLPKSTSSGKLGG